MPIYMKYDTIDGDVTEQAHKKWIGCDSFQWGVGRGIGAPTGAAMNRESSAPSVSEIVITKPQDAATGKLLQEAYKGTGKTVTIDFCATDAGQLRVYMQFTLTNTMISGFSTSSGGDRPSESVSLNFTKIMMSQTQLNEDNTTGDNFAVTYDVATTVVS